MTRQGRDLTARQASFLLAAVVTAYKLINLPSILCKDAGRDMWIGALLLMLWEVALTVAFVLLNRAAKGRTFGELLGTAFGRVAKRLLLALFGLYFAFKLYLAVITTEQFLLTNLYDKLGRAAFGVPILLIALYGAIRGLRGTGRTAELVGTVLAVGLSIALAVELCNTRLDLLLPIGHNLHGALGASERSLMGTGDAVVACMMIGRVETEGLGKKAIGAVSLCALYVTLFCVCFYGYYGDAGMYQRHGLAISDMLQYMSGVDTLLRLDIVTVTATLIVSLLKHIAFAWAACDCFRQAFGLADGTGARTKVAVGLAIVLIGAELLLQQAFIDLYSAFEGWPKYVFIVPFQVSIPTLAGIAVGIIARKPHLRPLLRKRPPAPKESA